MRYLISILLAVSSYGQHLDIGGYFLLDDYYSYEWFWIGDVGWEYEYDNPYNPYIHSPDIHIEAERGDSHVCVLYESQCYLDYEWCGMVGMHTQLLSFSVPEDSYYMLYQHARYHGTGGQMIEQNFWRDGGDAVFYESTITSDFEEYTVDYETANPGTAESYIHYGPDGLHKGIMNSDEIYEGYIYLWASCGYLVEVPFHTMSIFLSIEVWPIGDLDFDKDVDLSDLSQLLSNYRQTDAVYEDGDIDGDGIVGLSDLAEMLAHYRESW